MSNFFTAFVSSEDMPKAMFVKICSLMGEVLFKAIKYDGIIYPVLDKEQIEDFGKATRVSKLLSMGHFCPATCDTLGLKEYESLLSAGWVREEDINRSEFQVIETIEAKMAKCEKTADLKVWSKELPLEHLSHKTFVDVECQLCHECMTEILKGNKNINEFATTRREFWMSKIGPKN